MSHDFYGMSIGAGFFLAVATVCGTLIFKMLMELLGDILDSINEVD